MGCGKSSVGRRLSELLCCSFVDLDSVIEEREGRSIPEIFASEGERHFRLLEKDTLSDVLHVTIPKCSRGPLPLRGPLPFLLPQAARCKSPQDCLLTTHEGGKMPLPHNRHTPHETHLCKDTLVVALGGGTVMTPECAEMVKSETLCIYLRASVGTLVRNLEGEAAGRPMLQSDSYSGQDSVKAGESEDAGSPAKQLRERIESLMSQRSETYENTAHIIIDTDGRSVDYIAQEIISYLNDIHKV